MLSGLLGALLGTLVLAGCGAPSEADAPALPTPVGVEVVRLAAFQPEIQLLGVVEAAASAEVKTPAGGPLHYADRFRGGLEDGAEVSAGELLATQTSTDVQLGFDQAKLEYELRQKELERSEAASSQGLVPAADVEARRVAEQLAERRFQAARQDLERLRIRSPIAGRLLVAARIPPGSWLDEGTAIATVLAAGHLRVEAIAPARYAGIIRKGAEARVEGTAPGHRRSLGQSLGRVTEISPAAGPAGSLELHVELPSRLALRPGEGVDVTVLLPEQPQALSVPEEALLFAGESRYVFVAERRGDRTVARRRSVSVGLRRGHRVAVTEGLKPGQEVVVRGADLLVDGTRIAVTGSDGSGRTSTDPSG